MKSVEKDKKKLKKEIKKEKKERGNSWHVTKKEWQNVYKKIAKAEKKAKEGN